MFRSISTLYCRRYDNERVIVELIKTSPNLICLQISEINSGSITFSKQSTYFNRAGLRFIFLLHQHTLISHSSSRLKTKIAIYGRRPPPESPPIAMRHVRCVPLHNLLPASTGLIAAQAGECGGGARCQCAVIVSMHQLRRRGATKVAAAP